MRGLAGPSRSFRAAPAGPRDQSKQNTSRRPSSRRSDIARRDPRIERALDVVRVPGDRRRCGRSGGVRWRARSPRPGHGERPDREKARPRSVAASDPGSRSSGRRRAGRSRPEVRARGEAARLRGRSGNPLRQVGFACRAARASPQRRGIRRRRPAPRVRRRASRDGAPPGFASQISRYHRAGRLGYSARRTGRERVAAGGGPGRRGVTPERGLRVLERRRIPAGRAPGKESLGTTKTDVVVAIAGVVPVAIRGPCVPRVVVPGPAADHTTRQFPRSPTGLAYKARRDRPAVLPQASRRAEG